MKLIDELLNNPIKQELAFPEAEYHRRLAEVRSNMEKEEIDVLLVSNTSNIGYLTGYDTTMPSGYTVLIVPSSGELILHCSELEAPCMLLNGWTRNIQVFYWYEAQDTGSDLARILLENGFDGKTIGLEMGYAETFASGAFDTKSYLTLKGKLSNATFTDATTMVMEVRLIKTDKELTYMKQAGEYSWLGLQASLQAIREGVSENEVVAKAYEAIIGAGSELMSIDPMMMSGYRTGYMPHIAYRRKKLEKGDSVYFEFTGTHNRYNAPSMRSAVVGEPSNDVQKLADASIETVNLLLENIKPGRTGHEVAQFAKKGLKSVPEAFFHGAFGYSIGMSFQPTWTENPMYIADGNDRELKPGMTFHLPICIWVPGEYGIGFSESIVVTEKGCECLTPNKNLSLTIAPALAGGGRA
ncbi:hypothetical protein ABE28_009700 [Peribacillus muralis]|uniref:Peptidase M24 n=1 Tax=Peribacillus muralis TaxID=264697 RepID=A0A1B3XN34_9BACI|nr:Xaa-Pro peptidase family protein [Peribacillus muralis]AOH54623.1 hypothetical protein ABE28_009700 [Peribacillus muralis]